MNESQIREAIKNHIGFLRENDRDGDFKSIYDLPVYNNVFIEDIALFAELTGGKQKVLDFGCGRGTSSYLLAEMGFEVLGLDVDYKELDPNLTSYVFPSKQQQPLWDGTIELTTNDSLQFEFYDGYSIPFEDAVFDGIFAYAVLEHVEDLELTLSELYRVLKPGGSLFVSRTPNKYSFAEFLARVLNMPAHENTYSSQEIKRYLKNSGFQNVRLDLVDFFPSNIPHKKLNAVYQSKYSVLAKLERAVRYTPLNLVTHHFRITAKKKY